MPRADETWLFAHAHIEQAIPDSELSSLERYLKSLQATITTDRDKMYSRLLSPRHLDAKHLLQCVSRSCVRSRAAGGPGQDRPPGCQRRSRRGTRSDGVELPFYYHWSFRTGDKADFESLVELLEPRVLDERIGIRSMDCARAGIRAGRQRQAGTNRCRREPSRPARRQRRRCKGLKARCRTDRTDFFAADLHAKCLSGRTADSRQSARDDQTDTSAQPGSDDDFLSDPVVTLPFYGQNHARQHKTDKVLLDVTRDGLVPRPQPRPAHARAAGLRHTRDPEEPGKFYAACLAAGAEGI